MRRPPGESVESGREHLRALKKTQITRCGNTCFVCFFFFPIFLFESHFLRSHYVALAGLELTV